MLESNVRIEYNGLEVVSVIDTQKIESIIREIESLNDEEKKVLLERLFKDRKPGIILNDAYDFWINEEDDIYDELYKDL